LLAAAVWITGGQLVAPNPAIAGPPPADLGAQSVRIRQPHGPTLAGWFIPGGRQPEASGAMLLLHGIRSNRTAMLSRARFLRAAGYAVLLIDLQAHGESAGAHIGFGWTESDNVRAAVHWLHKRLPGEPVGVIGVSLGGAAAVLGDAALEVDALVLESVYSSIERAVENRLALRLGGLGRRLAPLLLWQLAPRLGIPSHRLQPLNSIHTLRSPLLLIAGSDDQHTRIDESQALFAAAPPPKTLWIVDGAAHQDLHRYAPQRYQATVLAFLQRYMRGSQAGPDQADADPAN
jgi:fermentation-respiration switch protein FrsA (DUF1100 family)